MPALSDPSWPIAVVNAPSTNKEFLTFAKGVRDRLTGHAILVHPQPTLPIFTADIDAFELAETKVAGGGYGLAAQRNAKKRKVRQDLVHLRDYVQSVVEIQPDPAAATALIQSVLFSPKKPRTPSLLSIQATNGDVSGTVDLACRKMGSKVTYFWQHSVDQVSWTLAVETMNVRARVQGLTPGVRYYFRFRSLVRSVDKGFSQVVSLIVQ